MWQIINNYIGIFILGIAEIIFANIVTNKKIAFNNTKKLLIIFISILGFTLISTYLTGTIKTVLLYFVHMFEFMFLFEINYFKAMFLTFLLFVIIIVPDLLALLIVTKVIGMSKIICYNEFASSILSNIIVGVLLIILTIIFKNILRKMMSKIISDNMKIATMCLLSLLCIAQFFYSFAKEFKIDGNALPYLIVIIVFLIILFSLIKQTFQNNKLSDEYGNLMERMTTYEIDIENERILHHEAKNELRTIRAMVLEKQSTKEIVEYIDEIVKDKYEVKKEKNAKFGYLPPNGIKGLFYFKTQEAENKGIKVSINISKKIINSTLHSLSIKQQRDFGRILGVFLDNAIEASLESSVKQLGIEAYVNEENEFKLIISNTYNNVIDKKRIGLEKFSTKGNNRGRGLLLVRILVEKNEIFEIKNKIQENIYIQTIIIKNNQ